MKKLLLLLLIPSFVFSQSWVDKMQDAKFNFYETQQEFEDFWENKTIEKGKGWKQFKRWENFIAPRVYPDGILRPEILLEEYNKLEDYNNSNMLPYSTWTQVGPNDVPLQSNGEKRGIGRVNTVAFHPTDANTLFIGAPAGGLWKSIDGGQNWQTSTDFLTNLGVSDIAINPSNPDQIYIITGDRDGGDTYSYGLMKSLDGGNTFNFTGLSFNVVNQYKGNRVLIDPTNTDIIIVATSNGIYRSIDAGISFSHTYSGINMTDIEFHTTNTSIIYGASNGNTSIYKSTDNGVTWSQSGSGLPSTTDVVRACVAVTLDNPQVVYAMFGGNDNGFYGVYKSSNEGQSWTLQSNSPNLLGWDYDGSDSGGQAWYDLAFAVSPINEDILFVGGVNCWKSTNSGQSWNINTHWYGASGSTYMHADEHMIKYNPLNNYIYSGNDGGLYFSDNNGTNWTDISDGLHITQFYSLGVSQTVQDKVITGSQDNGTFLKTNTTWDAVIGGDGMECIIDYTNSNIMYGALYYGDVRKSTNGGNGFSTISTGNGAWETPYELDKNNPNIIYIGYDELVKSTDGGNSWNQITNNQTNGNRIDEIGLSKSDADRIYISDGSDMFRTTDGGGSWSQIDNNGLPNKSITYILVNPNDEDIVWVTLSGYTSGEKVYKTLDGGNSWNNISYSLPNVPVNCIEIDKGSTVETVYIGTDLGVWTSDSTVGSWNPFNQNSLPNVIVNELEMQHQSNTLFAATYGRGLWSIGLDITSPPSADFSYTDSIFCILPASVSFINNSYYSNSYYWDFGDGNTSTLANPSHTYTNYGTFTVSLIAAGPLGTDSIIKQQIISIDPNNPCIITLPNSGNGTLSMCNGTLYDVGGPNGAYYPSSSSSMTISPAGSNQITLNFSFFDVEEPSNGSSTCDYDYLEIFDGPDATAPSLGQYCNVLTGSPGVIISSGGSVTILLETDGGLEEAGFAVDWSCTFPNSPPVSSFNFSDSVSCNSTIAFTDLSSNGPISWQWDFGDGNTSISQSPIHTYSNAGTYTVKLKVTNAFGSDSLIINNAITILDLSVEAVNDSSCGASSFNLFVNSNSGIVHWYEDLSLQNLLDTGNYFTTPLINTTTSYYVQSEFQFNTINGGAINNLIGGGAYFNGNQSLIFDVFENCRIISAEIYANSANVITFELRDENSQVIDDTVITVVSGQQRIYFNFDVSVGNNYQLGIANGNSGLFRNNSGANYPYNFDNLLSITKSSASTDPYGYYYFFYDLEVKRQSCFSSVKEVNAIINNVTNFTQNISICNGESIVIGSNTYNTQGTYVDSFLTTNGCDSILTTNLSVGAGIQYFQNFNFCSGQGIQVGTNYYTTTGTYIDTIGLSGCDSIIITDLVVSTPLTVTNNQTICQGEAYNIGSNIYYAPGSYFNVLQASNGCDSVVNTLLSVLPPAFYYNYVSLCEGDSVSVGANTYSSAGNFIDTLSSTNSCDSVVSTEVSLLYLDVEIILNNNALQANTLLGNPTSYLWNTGETTSSIQINGAGDYWMIATDDNDCVSDTIFYTLIHSLIDNLFASRFNIYPNPTTGIVNIEFANISEDTKVKLFNVLGEIVAEKIVVKSDSKTTLKVDLSSFAKGIYFIELESEKSIVNRKLLLR